MVSIKETKKPINIPTYPINFKSKIDSKIPKIPWKIDNNVGTLFNFKADKNITDTLSNITKMVKIKKSWYNTIKDGSFSPLQKTNKW